MKIELINTNESFILSETQTFEEEKKVVEAPISDVVVIDDTLTSGQSILSTIKELDLINCNTLKTFTIFDRNSGGKENLEKSGYSNYSIFKYDIDSNSLVI